MFRVPICRRPILPVYWVGELKASREKANNPVEVFQVFTVLGHVATYGNVRGQNFIFGPSVSLMDQAGCKKMRIEDVGRNGNGASVACMFCESFIK